MLSFLPIYFILIAIFYIYLYCIYCANNVFVMIQSISDFTGEQLQTQNADKQEVLDDPPPIR